MYCAIMVFVVIQAKILAFKQKHTLFRGWQVWVPIQPKDPFKDYYFIATAFLLTHFSSNSYN